ncbi:hypothetical protein ALQ16_203451 [Pseudomonas syringae pv. actinidiae]|uniref:PKD repeat n=1 Tax=Pseudomonas syringae pv. actinidiae TaxID=103796 RepID=A0A2V0QEJ3_PSESF|nr:hypothetical protein ALQ16_203451 [Pseudomonas syringae pv. actinidiae]GBH08745.1 PKD repeat [Pseudomonas syringae pv. actinidiae]
MKSVGYLAQVDGAHGLLTDLPLAQARAVFYVKRLLGIEQPGFMKLVEGQTRQRAAFNRRIIVSQCLRLQHALC